MRADWTPEDGPPGQPIPEETAPAESATHDNVVHLQPPADDTDSWTPTNLNNLPDQPPIKPTLGGIGIVYPGKRHVFSGPPESAKTIAAYAVALQIVRTLNTVILIDFEMGGYDARTRLRELGATTIDLNLIHYIEPDQPATEHRITPLVDLRPRLVIIDAAAGAYDIQGLDDNKRADVEKLTRLYVRAFWHAGIATIFIDHVVKDTEARGRFAIGSERKLGGADVHLGFEPITPVSRGTTGRYKIVTHKDRGGYLKRGHVADMLLQSDPDTHAITYEFRAAEHLAEDAPFRPTVLMERVSVWLQLQTGPVSRKQVEDGIKGTNAKAKRQALDVLITEEFVQEQAGPRGAKLVSNLRLYKKDDPTCNPQYEATSSTSSDLVPPRPDEVKTTSSTSSPPYRGTKTRVEPSDDPTSSGSQLSYEGDDDIPF